MTYQYPPSQVSSQGTEANVPPSVYTQNYQVCPPSSNSASMEMHKDSFPLASQRLKHSASTPDVRPLQNGVPDPSQLGLAADKRRNKLGYHRTSVACGHCRRRKIRCIPSTSDVQGRCVNCIRLKKDCSFFPVDQQPSVDARPKAPSRASTGSNIESASPSPAMAPRHPPEALTAVPQYAPLAVTGAQHMAPPLSIKSAGAEGFSSESKLPANATSNSRPYDLAGQHMPNWMASDDSPNPATRPVDSNTPWRAYQGTDSPITPSFSPYTPNAPNPPTGWASASGSEHGVREDLSWASYAPAPPRAVSYSSDGHVSPQYPTMQQQARPYVRNGPGMSAGAYPQTVQTTVSGPENGSAATMTHGNSVPAGGVLQSTYGSWQQQYPFARPTGETYGNWEYGDHTSHTTTHPSDQIPTSNDHPAQPVGMYYSGR